MPVFQYTARTLKGDLVNDKIDLPSRDDVIAHLRKNRMVVVQVRAAPKEFKINLKFGGGVKTRDVVVFTRQFATMINAGLPLVQALDILSQQTENKILADTTRQVVYDVESGQTLADALRKHPKAFSDLYVNMVAAGEAGGILDTILVRLAEFLEKNDAIVRKVKGAMIYPGVILSVAVIAVSVLLIFVIPTFQTMFASVNLQLPLPTRIVIGMSNILKSYWWAIIGTMVATVFGINRYYQTAAGRLQIDTLLLKTPVLGDVLRKSAVSRFTRTLGTLISSGVSILDGLEITARTAGNMVIHNAVMQSRASIAGGETIAAPLAKSKVFPPMVISMISVGEQTGGMDEMLSKIADFYDDEVDAAVSALLSLMEPVMIVVLGVIVGGMVVAMYLPIFDMVNAVEVRGGCPVLRANLPKPSPTSRTSPTCLSRQLLPLPREARQKLDVAVHHGLHPAPPADDRLRGPADAHHGKRNRVRHHGAQIGLAQGAEVLRRLHAERRIRARPGMIVPHGQRCPVAGQRLHPVDRGAEHVGHHEIVHHRAVTRHRALQAQHHLAIEPGRQQTHPAQQ